jgi:RNA-splicing ligase RtcB
VSLDQTVWRIEGLLKGLPAETLGTRREVQARIRDLLLELEQEMPCGLYHNACRDLEDVLAYSRRAASAGKTGRSLEREVLRARGALRRLRSDLKT